MHCGDNDRMRRILFVLEDEDGLYITRVAGIEGSAEIVLLLDLPGVKADDLGIDLRDGMLTITGETKPLSGPEEEVVFLEYAVGTYYRRFTIPQVIDQRGIDARLQEGVLRLTLPKVEKEMPRKIAVKTL